MRQAVAVRCHHRADKPTVWLWVCLFVNKEHGFHPNTWIKTVIKEIVVLRLVSLISYFQYKILSAKTWTGHGQATAWNCFYLLQRCLNLDLRAIWLPQSWRKWLFASVPVGVCPPGVGDLSCHIQTKSQNGRLWPDLEILRGSVAALGSTDDHSVQHNFSIKRFSRHGK